MSKVKGKNVLVLFYDVASATYKPYACAMSCDLNLNTDIVETSVVGAGSWSTFRAIKNSFDGSITGLTNLNKKNTLSLLDLRTKQTSFMELLMRFQRTDENGNKYLSEGKFIISKSSDSGPNEAMNSFSIDLKGTGVLTNIITIVSGEFIYGSTNLDTTTIDHTEAEFLASVINENISDFLLGQNINAGLYNIFDKVFFVQVPNTEATFTKWSELGNPFSQDIPIDASFGSGTNLFFKSIRNGETIYITRYQTNFSGTIILSR